MKARNGTSATCVPGTHSAEINGKVSYLCLTRLTVDVMIAPPAHLELVRDLVCKARVPGLHLPPRHLSREP